MNKQRAWTIGTVAVGVAAALALLIPASPIYVQKLLREKDSLGEGFDHYLKELDSPDEVVRVKAIHQIGTLAEGTKAIPRLAKIMAESQSSAERIEASQQLRKLVPASRTAVEAMAKALEDPEPFVRFNVVIALSRLGTAQSGVSTAELRPAVPALIKAIKDKANDTNLDEYPNTIRDEAALALARATRGTAEAVPLLIELLEKIRADKSVKIVTVNVGEENARNARQKPPDNAKSANNIIRPKIMYARGLGEIGPEAKAAVPLLQTMIKEDEVSDFKIWAAQAIDQIEGKASGG